MIFTRALTIEELNEIFDDAPNTETRNFRKFLFDKRMSAALFVKKYAVEYMGIVSDGRPIYVAILTRDAKGDHYIYTIVNDNVKEQYSLYKISKRIVNHWLKEYGDIYATMEKINPANMKWTERIGFKKVDEDNQTITYCLKGE